MNSHHGFNILPDHQPCPSRRQGAGQPHSLNTSFGRQQTDYQSSPGSISGLSAPFSPALPSPSFLSQSSQSAMASRTYNPRQWTQSGPVSGSYMPFTPSSRMDSLDLTGMEGKHIFQKLPPLSRTHQYQYYQYVHLQWSYRKNHRL